MNTADVGKFFLVVSPGFEQVMLYELVQFLARIDAVLPEYEMHSGGIELTLPLSQGLALNQMRTPTRVLLRIANEKLLYFNEFEKFVRKLGLEKYFPLREVYVSSRSSRLKIKNEIRERFLKALKVSTESSGSDLYIRFFRDECTISLDTSGEDLFMRGSQKWVGEAPLRDNMAAALLRLSMQGIEDYSQWEVLDPMMGAGTFLLEAALLRKPLERSFSFQKWFGQNIPQPKSLETDILSFKGFDLSEKNVETATKNLSGLKGCQIDLKRQDLFSLTRIEKQKKRLVIINPPYGKRLKIKKENFFQSIFAVVKEKLAPDRLGIILPRGQKIENHQGYEQVRYLEFSNNSIDVHFHLYHKQ